MTPLTDPVQWCSVGNTPVTWTALCPSPATNRGFVEAVRYAFRKPGSAWTMRVDDEPLADVPGDPSSWQWEPGFFAGEVTAELIAPDGLRHGLYLLDVSPDPAKLGRETFQQMLDELWDEDPELVFGSEPATSRIGDLGTQQNPWLAFARLRRHAPDFLRALDAVRARPRRALEQYRTSVPLHQVRQADRYTALSAARSSAVLLGVEDLDDEAAGTDDCRLDVPVVRETLDAAANRTLLALALAVLHRARELRQRLEEFVRRDRESETRTGLGARWPARRLFLDQVAADLKRMIRRSPFADVSRAEVTGAGLNAVSADPVYARAWGRGWRALRRGVEAGERNERLWISPSWEIYERWCFLRVSKALRVTLADWVWERKAAGRWLGRQGSRQCELVLQPRFPASAGRADEFWSVSREREPDLLLIVRDDTGTRFMTVDAKYRATRGNVLDAMTSAHVYQDSLRIGALRSSASLLLVPTGGGAPWLEDPVFQHEHRVGVHAFLPERATELPAPVTALLAGNREPSADVTP